MAADRRGGDGASLQDDDGDDDVVPARRPSNPQRQDTNMSVLDYYHSTSDTGNYASSISSDKARKLGFESSGSSQDDLSMGPDGYYHPGRTSGNNSSADEGDPSRARSVSDSTSRRYSSTTVRYGDDHSSRHRENGATPTRSSFQSQHQQPPVAPQSDVTSSGGESSTVTSNVQRRPSKHAAANADNRRIAIMELDATVPTSAANGTSGNVNLAKATHRAHAQSEDLSTSMSDKRGTDHPRMAFIAPPDAAAASYTGLLNSPLSDKRHQRNSTPPSSSSDRPPLQHSRSRSGGEDMFGSKRYTPSGPRPLNSSLSFSSSGTSPSSSSSSFVQIVPASAPPHSSSHQYKGSDQLSRTSSARRPTPRSPPHPSSSLPASSETQSYVPPSSAIPPSSSGSSTGTKLGAPWTAIANASSAIVTPAIGQSKGVDVPVVGPTVRQLSPSEMIWAATGSSSLGAPGSQMGLASSPSSSSDHSHVNGNNGYDYEAHARNRAAMREREKNKSRDSSYSPPPRRSTSSARSRSNLERTPKQESRYHSRRRSSSTSSDSSSASLSPSPTQARSRGSKHGARPGPAPYTGQQIHSSETSYMFYDPGIHGIGPPPPPPPLLRSRGGTNNSASSNSVPPSNLAIAAAIPIPASTSTSPSPGPTPTKASVAASVAKAPPMSSQSSASSTGAPPPRPPRRHSPPQPGTSASRPSTAESTVSPPSTTSRPSTASPVTPSSVSSTTTISNAPKSTAPPPQQQHQQHQQHQQAYPPASYSYPTLQQQQAAYAAAYGVDPIYLAGYAAAQQQAQQYYMAAMAQGQYPGVVSGGSSPYYVGASPPGTGTATTPIGGAVVPSGVPIPHPAPLPTSEISTTTTVSKHAREPAYEVATQPTSVAPPPPQPVIPSIPSTQTSAQPPNDMPPNDASQATLERNASHSSTSTSSSAYSYSTSTSDMTGRSGKTGVSGVSGVSGSETVSSRSTASRSEYTDDTESTNRPSRSGTPVRKRSASEFSHAPSHHREGASSTVSSNEPPSPPSKSEYSHHRSVSHSSYGSTHYSDATSILPPLPTSPTQGGQTLDDLMAAVGDAMADMGLSDPTKPSIGGQTAGWESKELPPIVPGTPSVLSMNMLNGETDHLQRNDTWKTGTTSLTLSSAFTGSSAVTGSSAMTGSSGVTGSSQMTGSSAVTGSSQMTSSTSSSRTSPGGAIALHEQRTGVSRTSSEQAPERDYAPSSLKHTQSFATSRKTAGSSSPQSASDYDESSTNKGVNHNRTESMSSISALTKKQSSLLRRRSSTLSSPGAGAMTVNTTHYEKSLMYPASQMQLVPMFGKSTSPLPPPPPERSKRLKQKAFGWPHAMTFNDVLKLRTALDRAAGYAEKINELAALDCGLEEWIFDATMQKRGLNYHRTSEQDSDILSPLMSDPSHTRSGPVGNLRRHRSRGSIATESTFPMRADAYTATNLRPDGASAKILPPALPYPSLAARSLAAHPTMRSVVSNSSAGSGIKTGFFASIGRKTSIRQKDRSLTMFATNSQQQGVPPAPRPSRSPARLGSPSGNASSHSHSASTPSASTASTSRPIQIDTTRAVAGGPRAQPRRTSVLVSNLITTTPQLFASADNNPPRSAPPVNVDYSRKQAISNPHRSSMPPPPPQHPSNAAKASGIANVPYPGAILGSRR